MNRQLKAEIYLRFDSQADAAQALGLQEPRLSKILHYRIPPSPKERRAFVRVFGEEKVNQLLPAGTVRPVLAATDSAHAEGV